MSQTTFDLSIEDLARLEREKELELSQIRAQVAAARQRSITTAAHSPGLPPASQSNLQFSPLPTSAPQDASLRATPCHGDLTVHTGPQPSVQYQHNAAHRMKRTKTTHTQPQHSMISPGASMVRSKSSSAAQNPFAGAGRVKPISPLQAQHGSRMDMMANFLNESEQQQPANNYVLAHSMDNPLTSHPRKSELATVMEASGTMEDPASWLSRHQGDWETSNPLISNDIHFSPYGQPMSNPVFQQPFQSQGFPTSQCGSLTSGPTIESAMTRSNSTANQSVSGQIQMMRLSSQSSMNDGLPSPEYGSFVPNHNHHASNKRPAPDDELLVGVGNNLGDVSSALEGYSENMGRSVSADSRRSLAVSTHPSQMLAVPMQRSKTTDTFTSAQSQCSPAGVQDQIEQSEPMMRSVSASSAKSTFSQRLRAKDSLHRQIAAGNVLLAPKPYSDPNEPELDAQPGSKPGKDGKVAVTKAKYERPKHPKVKCRQCDEYPDGFRGEHELRRHTEAKHGNIVKKYVCVDPTARGLKSDYQPVTPLEKCKHCRSGKQYGAYYNAAAHLRRAHFCKKPPRAKGAAKTGNEAEAAEKRGGKGGGDWPPMKDLKNWMEERNVSVDDQDALDANMMQDEDDMHNPDMEYMDGPPLVTAFGNVQPGQLDSATFYGMGGNLPIGSEAYQNMHDLYEVSPVPQLDTMMMPSVGSANFDFASNVPPVYNQVLPMDHNAYHSPNVSSSSVTLTAFNSFMETQQFSQASSQQTHIPMSQPSQDVGDMDFSLVFTGGGVTGC